MYIKRILITKFETNNCIFIHRLYALSKYINNKTFLSFYQMINNTLKTKAWGVFKNQLFEIKWSVLMAAWLHPT